VAISAPAIVLSVILGWPDQYTSLAMGALVILYTTLGGVKAVTWSDVQQMILIFAGLVLALFMAVRLLPENVSFGNALALAGAAGKLNPVVTSFDWNDRYTVWSGLIGGMFLALAYFGCDQSQVQRYLTGKSIAQSRLSLLFNAMAKIPMQFFILFIGTMVFVFYIFERPPLVFEPAAMRAIAGNAHAVQARFDRAFEARREAAHNLLDAAPAARAQAMAGFQAAQKEIDAARAGAAALVAEKTGQKGFNDTNYIFLSFVLKYLPAGTVGLIIAVIFAAAMSTIAGEVNSLATVTVIDVYRRHIRPEATDAHYLRASRVATAFWGVYAIVTAGYARTLGSLIEAVNILGSLFYGGMLGVFALAFFFPRVRGGAAFWGALSGEAAIFYCWRFTGISFLWYNVIGCGVVIATGVLLSMFTRPSAGQD
jgi:Na+/proline symporter